MNNKKIIAIDGPAGAGKSTVARELARRLQYIYIDTGAMYRALTLKALNQNLDLSNGEALTYLAQSTDISITHAPDMSQLIYMDGVDVTTDIRSPQVSNNVSLVAKVPGVREEMVSLQRQLANRGGVVMDGRDIGTNVLPNANAKFFITASADERARRRYIELTKQGYRVDLDALKKEIETRDKTDRERKVAPLVKAKDALMIDTSNMSVEEVVEEIMRALRGEK